MELNKRFSPEAIKKSPSHTKRENRKKPLDCFSNDIYNKSHDKQRRKGSGYDS